MNSIKIVLSGLLIVLIMAPLVTGRADLDAMDRQDHTPLVNFSPAFCMALHNIGQLELGINNNGTFGDGFKSSPATDCFTGVSVPSCDYPKGSKIGYLFAGAFWIGAIVGRDTVVSLGADGWSSTREFFPDESPFGDMKTRSILNPDSPEYENAISEQDYICVYSDTVTEGIDTDYFGRPHFPLNIEVTQNSYAWSYSYAEDFVLFDYQIKNIGPNILSKVYMGVYVDADVGAICDQISCYTDDLCGFLHSWPATYGNCEFIDTTNIAWIADNDGDFNNGNADPCLGVTATRIIRTPAESLDVSFNWWISNTPNLDFGPRHKENFRDYRTGGLGTPEGDVNKYAIMSNKEFDYDQAYTSVIQSTDSVWLYPDQDQADKFATGFDTRYLLSFGPFDINPGQTLPISFAYVAGADFHKSPNNNDFLPDDPDAYYAGIGFEDLATNATWAGWIYDNPGVDTDNDGYSGKYHVCASDSAIYSIDTTSTTPLITDTLWDYTVADTFHYEGDGVPDFQGASPPPAPDFWVYSEIGKLRVRFNGLRSETTEDVFARVVDFEGYRVYKGRDNRSASYEVVASFDIEDYNKLVFNSNRIGGAGYELKDNPFTIEQLRCLYGLSCDDESFDPSSFTRSSPYIHPDFPDDSVFIFEPQDFNVFEPIDSTSIRKIYPDAEFPSSLVPDSAESYELTDDGYLKYFEYEMVIENLLPTVPYYINVTAFDFGSPESGLSSLETSVTTGAKNAYALSSWGNVQDQDLKVYVYPNPYRIDATYRDRGLEGRTYQDRPPDRTRELHFANLPPKCTIKLYSLDGDLVREFKHEKDPALDATHMHNSWDLITRNTQRIVSGLYYWTVETPDGEVQMGKLAIIM